MGNVVKPRKVDMDDGCGGGDAFTTPAADEEVIIEADSSSGPSAVDIEEDLENLEESSMTSGRDHNVEVDREEEEITGEEFRFDYFVIGGGSGGLASAIQAAKLGAKVGLCDFVDPSPYGTSWGLGGTCVNVGCIPKKLMHQAALIGQSLEDAPHFGWNLEGEEENEVSSSSRSGAGEGTNHSHNWTKMVNNIHAHILSLNWGYRVSLNTAGVEYFNCFAEFLDKHTVKLTGKGGEVVAEEITSKYFLIATGGRPRYLDDVPGGGPGELCITSDDIFTLPHSPGKVIIVGASYIALETAGFLNGFGLDVTVVVRSQLLRGFDQEIAEKIGEVLESHGVQLLRDCVPQKIEVIVPGKPGMIVVHILNQSTGELIEEPCNTVILAVGRSPNVSKLNLQRIGVSQSPGSGKILVDGEEHALGEARNVYAVGDVCEGRPELTPVAIQSGMLLARRLFGGEEEVTDYSKIATCVFTPLEYGCVGLSEEKARDVYGDDDIEVYHQTSQPLELTLPKRDKNSCYSKLICVKSENERVCGFHYLGPNAGEVTQGFAVAIKLNARKKDLDGTIGIHPTCAEMFTTLNVTKSSGLSWVKTGC